MSEDFHKLDERFRGKRCRTNRPFHKLRVFSIGIKRREKRIADRNNKVGHRMRVVNRIRMHSNIETFDRSYILRDFPIWNCMYTELTTYTY